MGVSTWLEHGPFPPIAASPALCDKMIFMEPKERLQQKKNQKLACNQIQLFAQTKSLYSRARFLLTLVQK